MKNRLFTISKVAFVAFALLCSQACKEDYDMVDPPLMTDYDDDLDEEVKLQEGLENYFVTPYGEGTLDGSSWENAMDLAAFRTLLTGTTDLSKSTVYMSQGKYLMADESGMGMILRKDIKAIKGGYSQFSEGTDVSDRDVENYITVFSGDVNANKKADAGDCSLLVIKKGHIVMEGITLQYGYAAADITTYNSGIYMDGAVNNTIIELHDCVIRDCVSAITNSTAQGGPAIYNLSGQARLNRVKVLDNHAESRGGALRCQSDNAIIMLNACLLKGNSLAGMWGAGLQLSIGHTCINNTTMTDNVDASRSTTLNGGGSFLLTNNTFVGNGGNTNMGVFRCETKAGGGTKFINNVFVSENSAMWSVNGSNLDVTSMGYNVYQVASNITMNETDAQCGDFSFATFSEDGTYHWDIASVSALTAYATRQSVVDVAKSFNPEKSPIANLGQVFVEWVGEEAFAVDQRGQQRNPDKMQPGAYDAGLN